MSFAEQLRRKREGLKEGQTVVVDRSGRRFLEGPGGVLTPIGSTSTTQYFPSFLFNLFNLDS
jgi:hypothetical protein